MVNIDQINFENKRVVIRVDFNVPNGMAFDLSYVNFVRSCTKCLAPLFVSVLSKNTFR